MSTPSEGSALPNVPDVHGSELWLALVLSLGAAISLGITRFAYGLLLPPMRDDLGWTYTLAGAMNTFNAVGYLLGALTTPLLLRRVGPGNLLMVGAVLATGFMGATGFFVDTSPLLLQRLLAGMVSAWLFVAGGLLAARLGAQRPSHSGFILGLYYGGTGWGIVASALSVPWVMEVFATRSHAWAWAWWWLAVLCALSTLGLLWVVRELMKGEHPAPGSSSINEKTSPSIEPVPYRLFLPALGGYALFGVGYIGYMTFVIALLNDQGQSSASITWFYSLLGLSVLASSRLWAGLLDRHKDGRALARLNGLLGIATLLPALTTFWPLLLASGLLFGAVFLSVVASTTAWVRHNLPTPHWAAGISAFTVVFAVGQIVGPVVVGWISDGLGGLQKGLVFSAVALWLGAALAWRQRAL